MGRRLFLGVMLGGLFALAIGAQAVNNGWTICGRTGEAGSKTVASFFRQVTVAYNLDLSSKEDCSCGSNLGTIVFDGVAYSLPRSISKEASTYSIQYDAASWYEFSQWETTGEASITEPYSSSTTVTINGNSSVRAIYTKTSYTVYLDSMENTQATSNLGNITLGGVAYSLPNRGTLKRSATYSILFSAPSGYEFDHWETMGGVNVDNVSSRSTWVVGSSTGYVTGVYKRSIPQFPVYDLSLVGIEIWSHSVTEGQILPINVTVMNKGTENETCYLTMYANDTEFYSVQQMLTQAETRTISLFWNTSGLMGNYILKASAGALAGESNLDDNNLIYQSAITIEKAHMSTDLNKDGTVNIADIALVAVAYGSDPSSPQWNELADLDRNGIVNIIDVTMVAKDYGKTV